MSRLIDIDSKLLSNIDEYKNKILEFLFSGNDELIDIWLDEKDVVFDPLKFKNLFHLVYIVLFLIAFEIV